MAAWGGEQTFQGHWGAAALALGAVLTVIAFSSLGEAGWERGGVPILPGLQGCCLDNVRGNTEAILLFAWWHQERLR